MPVLGAVLCGSEARFVYPTAPHGFAPSMNGASTKRRSIFSHNPLLRPNATVDEFLALDADDRDKVLSLKAIQYDIVSNGVELSSGAIRNHRPDHKSTLESHIKLR